MNTSNPNDSSRQGELSPATLEFKREGNVVFCELKGVWKLEAKKIDFGLENKWKKLISSEPTPEEISFECNESLEWDSSLIVFLLCQKKEMDERGISFVVDYLPDSIRRLLSLSLKKSSTFNHPNKKNFKFLNSFDLLVNKVLSPLNFWGAWIQAIFGLLTGRSNLRIRDIIVACKNCGAAALPIVSLISFLTGLTLAFVGSVQLEKFNAKIYIADLVCLAMVREMGALMVGIVMAGRTGAAFAAEIGNMKLNEEIDALRIFGISPIEFLVLPRTIALIIMTPLLTVYADLVGILGGLCVGVEVMNFSVIHYVEQTQAALQSMWEIFSGLLKSLFFGLIIALVGCYKGMHTGNDSAALGKSVTSTVVLAVTLIVVSDALFEIIFSILDLR